MRPTTINLPSGHKIETEGVNHQSGANVHFRNPDGVMFERILAKEFREDPSGTMLRFQAALAACVETEPHLDEPTFQMDDDLYLIGSPDGTSITLSTYPELDSEGDGEILHYVCDEWEEEPEEVIGAFLNCLRKELGQD